MPTISELEALKQNIIELAKHHKKHCDGQNCNISLYQVRKLAEKTGIVFNDAEKRHFM